MSQTRYKEDVTLGMVKDWHGFSREVVDMPSLESFKVPLDKALDRIWWKVTRYMAVVECNWNVTGMQLGLTLKPIGSVASCLHLVHNASQLQDELISASTLL